MALLPWPSTAWLLAALVVLAAPAIGILWAPAIAMISDGAEAHGVEQAIAFALVDVGWAVGETAGRGRRLPGSGGDAGPTALPRSRRTVAPSRARSAVHA